MLEETATSHVDRSTSSLRRYVQCSVDQEPLTTHIVRVLSAMPDAVRRDLLEDTAFRIILDREEPGRGRTVWLSRPAPGGRGSRSVVFRWRLVGAADDFALYVIAHELAHAYLRNGAWGDISDPELAADAMAAGWGFKRPQETTH